MTNPNAMTGQVFPAVVPSRKPDLDEFGRILKVSRRKWIAMKAAGRALDPNGNVIR